MLVRLIECIEGQVQIEAVCEPMFDYGRTPAQWKMVTDDWSAAEATDGDTVLRLISDLRIGIEGNRARARHTLSAGRGALRRARLAPRPARTRALRRRQGAPADDVPLLAQLAGRRPLPGPPLAPAPAALGADPQGPDLRADRGHGGGRDHLAARRRRGGERNWDYRYCWMRDATFTLWGLHALGLDWEADDFMQFVADLERDGDGALQIMYGLGGERDLHEQELAHLTRLRRAPAPVRIGNGAYQPAPERRVRRRARLGLPAHQDGRPHPAAPVAGDPGPGARARSTVWREPDQGIWEARGEPKHYVSSKLMCWVALDRGARLAEIEGETELADRSGARSPTRSGPTSSSAGVSERGVFRQHYETDALDASTLLIPLVRFLPPDDERVRATVLAIADELQENGFILRYRVEETDDGLSGEEGTFLICSFWLVSALSEIGEAGARRAAVRAAARPTPRRSACTPRSSRRRPGATWATSRRRSPTWR